MRVAITGASGNGKTTLAQRLEREVGLHHVEIDALHHGPSWQSCGAETLRERVLAATAGDGWVADATYAGMLGDLVVDRADVVVWLDLPAHVVMWRLLRRTFRRIHGRVVLWNGNVEDSWRDAVRYLLWPALRRVFENRRELPARGFVRLRSDEEVEAFVQAARSNGFP